MIHQTERKFKILYNSYNISKGRADINVHALKTYLEVLPLIEREHVLKVLERIEIIGEFARSVRIRRL